MDALQKLQERNRKYSKHQKDASWNVVWMVCMISPLLFSYGYEFYFTFKNIENGLIDAPLMLLLTLSFSLPMAAAGSLIDANRFIKLMLFVMSLIWFTWFCVVTQDLTLAYMPLLAALVTVLIKSKGLSDR